MSGLTSSRSTLCTVVLITAWSISILECGGGDDKPAPSRIVPLPHAHAHNDYEHPHPLGDALENGFCSVEADVFLQGSELLVGHRLQDVRPNRTLESLYLDPLRKRVRMNGGRVYRDGPAFYLLVDVKTEAEPTYAVLAKVLSRYDDILSVVRSGKLTSGAVTVVVSGNCARKAISADEVRYAGVDGRPADLDSTSPADLIPWVSAPWSSLFQWRGDGDMPNDQRVRLREFVKKCHQRGRLVRFWATPEKARLWEELLAAEVDLINTDKLSDLRGFLLGARLKSSK